jgi:hypothetical protein
VALEPWRSRSLLASALVHVVVLTQSQNYFAIDSLSVSTSWCRAHSGTYYLCYFPLEVWYLKFSVLSLFWRLLWREVGSVICQSKSVVVCQGKIHIYIFCAIHISNMYIQYIQGLLQSRLGTTDYALLFTSSHATTAVQTLERSYTWPPPSLSLLYFLCRASPYPM